MVQCFGFIFMYVNIIYLRDLNPKMG